MQLPLIDLVVFFVYLLGIILFGVSFSFKGRTSNDFQTGGGRLPAWALGMSIFATYVSSISFLALPGNAYQSNWNVFVFGISIPIAAYMAVRYFVPLYRSLRSESAYFYLEERFGPWARTYASVCYLLTQLARMGAIMYLLALPMHALLGWDVGLIIVVTGVSVILYSMLGGIEAVVWTDAVQAVLLIAGAIACIVVIFVSMPEGPAQVFSIAMENQKFSLGSMDLDFTTSTFWMVLVYGLFINLQNFGVDQSYVQRYVSARTDAEAKKSTLLGSLLYIPVSFLFLFIGTALYSFYQANPENLPAELQLSGNADKVFPHFIASELPLGLTGLLIASVFAAGMSTVSTSINSSATLLLSDHYQRYINPQISEKQSLRFLRIASLTMGGLSVLVGLAFNGVSSALEAWWALSSIFSGGILGLFFLGLILNKTKKPNVIPAMIVGVLAIAWVSLSPVLFSEGSIFRSQLHTNMTIVVGTMTIFLLGFLFTWLVQKENGKPIKSSSD
ncbi:sodium:solute symporter [Algoriphagus sp. CAU 1675]|uniref:sodium:solute symporter n=1 Tax=Algoriphagus sp. CAU 1675 TaxID=3032597 RepID=UPI0023D97900|nr:sodium:solute symporter [Algoriphagus sp. CAU 1675]MDF2157408.1 sodium:solute symporter [Algoriphagus sp. CAU 1675]